MPDARISADDAQRLGLPAWAVGRSFAEITQFADTLYQQALSNVNRTPPAPTAPPPSSDGPPTADDWALDPAGAAQRHAAWLERQADAKLSGSLNTLYQQNASTALDLVRSRHKDAFERWGPEILELINGIAMPQRTAESLGLAVDIVRGRHAGELSTEELNKRVEAELQKRIEAGSLARPSGTGANAPPVLDYNIEDLPANYRELLESQRLLKDGQLTRTAFEFFEKFKKPGQKTDEFIKDWFEAAKKGDVVFAQTGRGLTLEDA